jgi:pimeloyl-ACP methyl ester carboxylesterase
LHFELRGPEAGAPVLLIQGLGQQLIDWPEALVEALAARHRVVLCDNRDSGLSPLFGPALDPRLVESDFPTADGSAPAPYTLQDMAEDARGVLDRLGITRASVVGYSMGGMIGQILAARYPTRVRKLVSLMSSDGANWIDATHAAHTAMARSVVGIGDRSARLERLVEDSALYRGPHLAFDRAEARRHIAAALDRADRPAGIFRQALAMRGSGDRRALLRTIACPTLVVHGTDDPVIAAEQGRAAAARIPGARLEMLERAGHDFAPEVTDHICRLVPDFLAES